VTSEHSPTSIATLDLRQRQTVAVLGAGAMGQGIAQVTASHGHLTLLYDVELGRAEAAIATIKVQLEKLVDKGKISQDACARTISAIHVMKTLRDACTIAGILIEAAPENLELKVALLREAESLAPPHALLGSNTSSLSLTELGARLDAAPARTRAPGQPSASERTVGLHFFNPAPVMDLLEVVSGIRTSKATIDRALAFAQEIGKTPIVVRDTPGFASSRLGVALGAEAIRMLEANVASARDIDRAMELGYRHPMGPLKLTDLVGLDVRLSILEHLHRELGEVFRPPPLLRLMVRAGKLGKKTGEGFYVWKDGHAQ
jgi:3-hydroxybutyryl-CoA dehydrogenase